MKDSLRRLGIQSLKQLRLKSRANNLTCHFFNPHSGLYWLFCKEGHFEYPNQMHGPLSNPDQSDRFRFDNPRLQLDGIECYFFDTLPDSLTRNILGGKSFAKREGVKKAILIRFFETETDRKGEECDSDSPVRDLAAKDIKASGPEVYIFLNYTAETKALDCDDNFMMIHMYGLAAIRLVLIELARQPRINPKNAWKLRGLNMRFRAKLSSLKWLPEPDLGRERTSLFKDIVNSLFNLIKPRDGKNTLCTLSLVDVNNQVEIVASTPEISPNKAPGIVDYVARTGQLFSVCDVAEYQALCKQSPNDECLPHYQPWCTETRCEIAVPLLVHRRVIGVLNLEADHPDAFQDSDVLLLFQYASTAALMVRMTTLFKDLNAAFNLQEEMLACDCELQIFHHTLKAFEGLGYSNPGIWDVQNQIWIQLPGNQLQRSKPREGGYTQWVASNGLPLVLPDLKPPANETPVFPDITFIGKLSDDGYDFLDWYESTAADKIPRATINPDVFRHAGSNPGVITDMAFPIFSGEPGCKREVRAVVWAKCRRYFRALFADECCCLALFCRCASKALSVSDQLYAKREEVRKAVLQWHFGPERVPIMEALLEKNKEALTARLVQDVITLNADMRGSTVFSQALGKSQDGLVIFRSFFSKLQRLCYDSVIHHCGVFDKHMGDGFMALFNIYRQDVFPDIDCPSSDKTKEMLNAIRCVELMFRKWEELVINYKVKIPISLPNDFALGAGLSIGEAFVGSFYAQQQVPGFDFSAHGVEVNTAAKLQGSARAKDLVELLDREYKKDPASIYQYPLEHPLSEDGLHKLKSQLMQMRTCILIMTLEFEAVLVSPIDNWLFYRVPLEGEGKPIRILGVLAKHNASG